MKPFSLRRRVLAALVAVFLVGVVATYAFYRLELRHELRGMEAEFHARPLDDSVTAESLLSRMRGEDVEFLGIVFVPVALLGVFIIGFVLRWSLRGLTRASEEAGRIRPGETGRHLTNDGLPVELHPLVDAVNAGLERLALAYGAERQLTADCAHQLRTPLTVMRLRLESARERPFDWPAIERDLAHLERLVTQLLDLSRKENASGRTREPLPVNLSRLLRETVADWLPLAQKQSRPVEIEATDTVHVVGHAEDLADLIRNLLDNALTHGLGRIIARLECHEGRACLSVTDDGVGIPPEQRERVFNRFVKLDPNSAGAGLGLCIVRQILQAHNGDCGVAADTGAVWTSLPCRRAGTPSDGVLA